MNSDMKVPGLCSLASNGIISGLRLLLSRYFFASKVTINSRKRKANTPQITAIMGNVGLAGACVGRKI